MLCKLEMLDTNDFLGLFRAAEARYKWRVAEYFGDASDVDVVYYRLEPPPHVKAFTRAADHFTITDLDEVLQDVEKIELDPRDTAGDTFGTNFDPRSVPLYIERRTVGASRPLRSRGHHACKSSHSTMGEGGTESIQSAFDSSEDMRIAMQEMGLDRDLFVSFGVRFRPSR